MEIPEELKQRLIELDIPLTIYDNRARKCIGLLRKDCSLDELGKLEKVPWHDDFYFCENSAPGKTKAFENGCFVVMDAASIIPVLALGPKPKENVLDLCAAPGQKTILIARLMRSKGDLVANDINRERFSRLKRTVLDYNIANAVVLNENGATLKFEGDAKFNKILVDAPCSGEGIVNKPHKVFKMWKEKHIERLSKMQKSIIDNAFMLLQNNGTLVYATCTFEPMENESVIDFLLRKHKNAKLEKIKVKGLVSHNGLTQWREEKYSPELKKCLRIYPQDNETNGMFVAKIVKT
ncbi:MAG: RsmB/NOP family class I SAM-dependent RNA methyltransferase [Candidatus Aenigmatarchaeota archaeon]